MFLKTQRIFSATHGRKCPWRQACLSSMWILFLYMEIHFPYNLKLYHLYSNFISSGSQLWRIFVSGIKRTDTEVISVEQFLYGNQISIKQHYFKTSWRKSWPALTVFSQLIQEKNFRSDEEFIFHSLIQDTNHHQLRIIYPESGDKLCYTEIIYPY